MGEQVIELARLLAHQMGEYLALLAARQIRAGRGRRKVELRRIARMLGHEPSAWILRCKDRAIRRCRQRIRVSHGDVAGHGRGIDGAKALARAGLLTTTVPTRMSCSRRWRLLNRPTRRTSGVSVDTVSQNTMACAAPSSA